jgi:hypothetical protein
MRGEVKRYIERLFANVCTRWILSAGIIELELEIEVRKGIRGRKSVEGR